MQIGALFRLAETMFAFDLDVIEAMGQFEAFDLGALGLGGAVGHQRQFDPARLQRVDGIMRAGEHVHRFFAIGGEAVGETGCQIIRQGMAT